jgi:hypothetical protein
MNIMNYKPLIGHQSSSQTSFSLGTLQDAAETDTHFLIICIKSHRFKGKDQKYLGGLLEFEL